MTRRTLWRFQHADDPHFGSGSFWTTERDAASTFGHWVDVQQATRSWPQTSITYRVDVDMDDAETMDLLTAGVLLVIDEISESKCQAWKAEGKKWVVFRGQWSAEEQTLVGVIYLGDEPLPAVPAD